MSKVPVGWEKTTLEKFISIKHGFAFKSEFFSDQGDFVLLTPGHFYEHGGFREQKNKTKYYTGCIPNGYILNEGDVLLAMTEQASGLLGSAIFIPEGNRYLHNQRLGLINITEPKSIDYAFLYLIYNSPEVRKQIAEQASGTKVKHTSPDRLRNVFVLLPPLLEQTKIAQILSTWDKAIATTEQLIGNSQQQKKALMQSLLTGKKRLPGFKGKWTNATLEDACYINPKKALRPEDGLVTFISMDSVSEDAKLIRAEVRNYVDVEKGFTSFSTSDVLVAKITPCFENGKGAYLDELKNGVGFGSTEFHVLRAKKHTHSKFIYYVTITDEFRVRGEANMQGSAGQKRVTTVYLKQFTLNLPPLPEQQKIAQILTAADNEIELLQKKLAFLKQEKTALMQQLLTGKRRVKVEAA